MRTPPTPNGYSLLELMVVLVVIGIIVGAATPSLQGYMERHRNQRVLDQVATDLALTRLVAVREGRPATLGFEEDGYAISASQGDGSVRLVKRVSIVEDFPGVALDADGDVAFNSRGLVQDAGQIYVRVTNLHGRDSLVVSPAGRVYRAY